MFQTNVHPKNQLIDLWGKNTQFAGPPLALICMNIIVNVIVWNGDSSNQVNSSNHFGDQRNEEAGSFWKSLPKLCQKLIKTLQEHLKIMIKNGNVFECNELLFKHLKLEFQRIDRMYKDIFTIQINQTSPKTVEQALSDM